MDVKTAAFFDIDGTLTSLRTWTGYLDYFRRRNLKRTTHLAFVGVHYPLYFVRQLGLISESAFRRPWAAHLAWYVRGISIQDAQPIWEYTVRTLDGSWRTETRQILKDHLRAGDLVMLVSSGPYPMVARIAAELGVEHFIGTRLETRGDVFTGRSIDPVVIDESKASAARAYLAEQKLEVDLNSSFAYADSTTDLSLLEMVGNPVAVYPDDGLRSLAVERGWKIVSETSQDNQAWK